MKEHSNDVWCQPICEKKQCGENLRLDTDLNSPYRQMRDLRQGARDQERRQEKGLSFDNALSQWQSLYDLTEKTLTKTTKDIELMAWHIEASLRLYGLTGLARALDKTQLCIARFSEQLWPEMDDEDPLWKTQALNGLNGEMKTGSLIFPINNISLSDDSDIPLWQYLNKEEAAISAFTNAPISYVKQLKRDVDTVLLALAQFKHTVDSVFFDRAPLTQHIKSALEQLACVLNERLLDVNDDDVLNCDNALDCETALDINEKKPIGSRNAQLIKLKSVAAYFREREPHSPIPYMLERIIVWADLPLPELLSEMINNSSELQQVYALTGIEHNQ